MNRALDKNQLLLQVLADPDDDEARLVYGDCLQAENDPLGELIALQHARERSGGDIDRLIAEREFLAAHAGELLGEQLAAELDELEGPWRGDGLELHWRLGFIERARIGRPGVNYKSATEGMANGRELLLALLTHDRARLVRELTVCIPMFYRWVPFMEELSALLAVHPAPPLRRLQVGDFISARRKKTSALTSQYPERDISAVALEDMSEIWPRYQRLEELELQGNHLELGDPSLPLLRSFTLYSSGCSDDNIESIIAARWPALERLVLWLGDGEYGGENTIEQIRRLIDTPMPRVTQLALANSEHADAICHHLAGSALASQLVELDLSLGTLTHEGARALTREAFPALRELWVQSSYLLEREVEALGQWCLEVYAQDRRDPHQGRRYVRVSE